MRTLMRLFDAGFLVAILVTVAVSSGCTTYRSFKRPQDVAKTIVHDRFVCELDLTTGPFTPNDSFLIMVHTDLADTAAAKHPGTPDTLVFVSSLKLVTKSEPGGVVLTEESRGGPHQETPYRVTSTLGTVTIGESCNELAVTFEAVLFSIRQDKTLESETVTLLLHRNQTSRFELGY